jgi:CRISPR-associated exonuclease Cas4
MLPLILILIAVLLWFVSQRAQRASGLPAGQVVYTDTGGWGRPEKPLFSQRLQLTGKPDYLVREGAGYVPVEVKSGRAPVSGPHAAHVYQLAAYCALIAEAYGRRPAYGLIKYTDEILRVDFTPGLEAELLELLDEMRADADAEDVSRSHSSAARCRACGFREICEESLG